MGILSAFPPTRIVFAKKNNESKRKTIIKTDFNAGGTSRNIVFNIELKISHISANIY